MEIPYVCCIFVPYLESIYISIMIKVSETAKSKVLQLMQDDGFDPSNDFVRVGVKSGGCSGLSDWNHFRVFGWPKRCWFCV